VLNLKNEITKAEKRILAIEMSVEKLEKQMKLPEYESKIPDDVKESNSKMVRLCFIETLLFFFRMGKQDKLINNFLLAFSCLSSSVVELSKGN
jgi:hypothetical protein